MSWPFNIASPPAAPARPSYANKTTLKWRGTPATIQVTQNAGNTLKFPLAGGVTLVQSLTLFAHPANQNILAIGNQEIFFVNPATNPQPGSAYLFLAPGQSARAFVTDPNDWFDLHEWWVAQVSQTNTNYLTFTVWTATYQ